MTRPCDATRERAREAARIAYYEHAKFKTTFLDRHADAASDVWQAEVERLRAETVARSALVQVGWVRDDGDEYHQFIYSQPDDRRLPPNALEGCLPVYVIHTEATT